MLLPLPLTFRVWFMLLSAPANDADKTYPVLMAGPAGLMDT